MDTTAREFLVPGAMVLLRTPQGEVTVSYGTTELGTTRAPRRHPLPDRVGDQDDDGRGDPAAGPGGEAPARRSGVEVRPRVPNGDGITLAQLLEMRSGLYSFTDDPALSERMDDDPTRVWAPQELLDLAFAQPPMFAPGAEYYYSNTNYVLLGLIIEQLEGRPLAACSRSGCSSRWA